MNETQPPPLQPTGAPALLGLIEPHAGLLTAPSEGQRLYKVMTAENLLRSIAGSYLYFNRVDAYPDLDPNDGAMPPGDQQGRFASLNARMSLVRPHAIALRCLPVRLATIDAQAGSY